MFKNLFNEGQPKTSGTTSAPADPAAEAMKRAITEQKKKGSSGNRVGKKSDKNA